MSSAGRSISAAVRSASTCRWTSSSPTTSSRKPSWSPKGSKCAPVRSSASSPRCSGPSFEQVQSRVSPLELGPPVGWPLQVPRQRTRPDESARACPRVRIGARQQPERAQHQLRLERAVEGGPRRGGSGSRACARHQLQALSQTINAVLSGTNVTQLRDSIYLIDIVARADPGGAREARNLRSLMLETPGGKAVPLAQVAKLSYGLEPPMIWRRHRVPTVTVQADIAAGVEAATVVAILAREIAAFKAKLPAGYDVVAGGRSRTAPKPRPASSPSSRSCCWSW